MQAFDVSVGGLCRGDQAVRAAVIEVPEVWHLSPAPGCIQEAANLLQARDAATNGVLDWSLATKQGIIIWPGHPPVGMFGRKQSVKRLVNSDQVRDPRELVLPQGAHGRLHLVES
jgi:hypothetical protein